MAKPELGTKRLCPHCGAKFYDLSKDPIVCPKCGSVVEIIVVAPRGRPDAAGRAAAAAAAAAAKSKEEAEARETQDAEFVSLEDADAEGSGSKVKGGPDVDEDEDAGVADDAEDDATFLEADENEDEDVSDIIGGDREDEEET